MGTQRGWEVATRLMQWVLVPMMAFLAVQVIANAQDLAEIKGNRFSAQDGLTVWKEIAAVRSEMAELPQESPPAWFIEHVRALEATVSELTREVVSLQIQVAETHGR